MHLSIHKVAVLGAGVMGSQIAAHFANAGIPSYLLDIVPSQLTQEEKSKGLTLEHPTVRNRFSQVGIENVQKLRPAALYSKTLVNLMTPGNFEDHLDRLGEVDWVIEAVVENLEIKKQILAKIVPYLGQNAFVTSNTSGLSLAAMGADLPLAFQERFFITHFFNPVRYMKLLEIIPGEKTNLELVKSLADFAEETLGKGIVFGKDTPCFVANRIGAHNRGAILKIMQEEGYTVEEVDAIMGEAIGRPKTALFRLSDLVGLDTSANVIRNLYRDLPQEEDRDLFILPDFVEKMLERGWVGNKAGQGFYKKVERDGKTQFLVLDLEKMDYRPQQDVQIPSIEVAKKIDDPGARIKYMVQADDRGGRFAWKALSANLIYAAKKLGEIAEDVVNIDRAMRWGYNWELGPFETWDALGVKETVARLEREGREVPESVKTVLSRGDGTFYKQKLGTRYYFDLKGLAYQEIPLRPQHILLSGLKEQQKVIKKNPAASLIDLGDGVACLEFHTKANTIDEDLIEMIRISVEEVSQNFQGLVIGNEGVNFCAGANLVFLLAACRNQDWSRIEQGVKIFQDAVMLLRYSPKPVVAAPFGMTLGGGCEIALGSDRICAHAELYMGQVEVGVGLIPAGGGTKELLIRSEHVVKTGGPLPKVQHAFETIAYAKVSSSAKEAQELGFLMPEDKIIMNRDHLLYEAKHMVLNIARSGYRQPTPREDISVPGSGGRVALEVALKGLRLAGKISSHDEVVAKKLAYVLTGGNLLIPKKVSEQYLLDLEREAFVSLCGYEKTQQRMEHMLRTGKPLRN
ncbi:MAG TPA: 3-hydroxyacyl-CoA dehydrogenase/enoyl-CoA hydratase family protein [Candidatus Limnocylindrales bacterium]|nr:3-hydroxyacyl-CoA dehydrogenase/enoyl-CoA hydratase family protein [Candidatus Limnocylindrales bacterium]